MNRSESVPPAGGADTWPFGAVPLAPPLLPILAAEAEVTPEIDRMLTAVAKTARAGDRAARDALFFALQPKIHRSVQRCYRWSRWQSAAWDDDDLNQEAFLLFELLLQKWPGNDSFSAYFFSRFPHRLHDTVRRSGAFRPCCPPPTLAKPKAVDPDVLDDICLRRLAALAVELTTFDAQLLLWHIRDRQSFQAIARRQGCHPMTVRRHWYALLPRIHLLLAERDWG